VSSGGPQYPRTSHSACTLLLVTAGCAGTSSAAQHAGNAAADSELTGVWAEYWSPAGQAETQRYTFLQGGDFQWTSAPSAGTAASGTPLRKNGSFELKQLDQRRLLVLHVAETELAGCDSACGDEDAAYHVAHTPALLEELELSDCPPNAEAQNIDAKYACLTLGEHAFWRRDSSVPAQSKAKSVTPTAAVAAPLVAEPPVEPPAAASSGSTQSSSVPK
jgi:hypothetical protein